MCSKEAAGRRNGDNRQKHWPLGHKAHEEVQALQSYSRTGSRPSVTLVGGVCLNCARGSAGPAFPMPISCRPRVRGRHCFAGGGPRNLGAQCAGYSHRLETEHEKLAAVVGGANTRVNWGQDHPRFSWCGTGVRLTLGLRWLRFVWFDSTRPFLPFLILRELSPRSVVIACLLPLCLGLAPKSCSWLSSLLGTPPSFWSQL